MVHPDCIPQHDIGLADAADAGDKTAAARNMAAARELIPGAAPTAGEVAQDAGIAQLQRALSNADPQLAADLTVDRSAEAESRRSIPAVEFEAINRWHAA